MLHSHNETLLRLPAEPVNIMKVFCVVLWVAYLASLAVGKLVRVNGIPKIKLRTDTKHVADGPVVATVEADSIASNLMPIRGGAKSPIYLLYRKLSRILRPYLPKSWRKPYSFGTSNGSVKKGRYGKGKEQKSGAKGNRDSTSPSSGLVKHNRLQKVTAFRNYWTTQLYCNL